MRDKKFGITPAYDILLRGTADMPIGLYHLGLATTKQLTAVHYSPKSEKAVGKKLRILVDNGYVQLDAIPTKFTRSPYYYALDKLGLRYLRQAGLDINQSFRASKEVDKHSLFVQHTLELNDVIISAACLKKSNPDYWLNSFIHERTLKRAPYKVSVQGNTFSLIPDAFLDFRVRVQDGQRRMPVIIEHDRGSEEQKYFRKRIKAYAMLLRSEGYKKLFGVGSITIAFTTSAGPARLGRMREWTWQELQASGDNLGLVFYFANLERPIDPQKLWLSPSWYTLEDNKPVALLGV